MSALIYVLATIGGAVVACTALLALNAFFFANRSIHLSWRRLYAQAHGGVRRVGRRRLGGQRAGPDLRPHHPGALGCATRIRARDRCRRHSPDLRLAGAHHHRLHRPSFTPRTGPTA